MQDRYAGDVGDFGKFGLLRALQQQNLRLGINWYKVQSPDFEKDRTGEYLQQDGKHEIKDRYAACDPELAEKLRTIFRDGKNRSIAALQRAQLLDADRCTYYNDELKLNDRAAWHKGALEALKNCDLVFLDPDNGLLPESVGLRSARSIKYVLDNEWKDYLRKEKSVVLYSHRPRKKASVHFLEMQKRFSEREDNGPREIQVLTFPKGTVRDYFLIAAKEAHAASIRRAVDAMAQGPWGQMGLCLRQNALK